MLTDRFAQLELVCVILGCGIVTTAGCGRRVDASELSASSSAVQGREVPVASAAREPVSAKAEPDEGCFVDHNQPVRDDGATVGTDPVTGAPVTRVGGPLPPDAIGVTVGELLKRPEAFLGKLVRVEGSVTAMCGHRRAWFAVVEPGTQGPPVRIITAPAFLVPKDAMGKVARAVGTVEIREITAQAAAHQAKDHGMPEERRIVTLKATGAEFR